LKTLSYTNNQFRYIRRRGVCVNDFGVTACQQHAKKKANAAIHDGGLVWIFNDRAWPMTGNININSHFVIGVKLSLTSEPKENRHQGSYIRIIR
jgi:hypothetical protein